MATFRIRRIYDDSVPANRQAIAQVREILRSQFDSLPESTIEGLGEKLRNPFEHQLRTILFVAEDSSHQVLGFALVRHEPVIHFFFLDFLASSRGLTDRGTGGSLYERVRETAVALDCLGVLLECLPDDPEPGLSAERLAQNRARLRFYERFGARPVIGTAYETPLSPDDTEMPHLVFDGLDRPRLPPAEFFRKAVRAILERKYRDVCSPEYVNRVVASLNDGSIRLRPPRYRPASTPHPTPRPRLAAIPTVVNDRHQIHHIRERGYVEAPVRIASILGALEPEGLVRRIEAKPFPDRHLTAVHDPRLVAYLRRACNEVPEGKSLYPYIFPIRNPDRLPKDRTVLAGYFCIDTFTPIHRNAWPAARRAVDCALTAASLLLGGEHLAYALVRPPGHHAEHDCFGGFCYFNNCAVAAHHLSAHGKVAILDIDYHHGNGQQQIFYRRADVLTLSLHGHPRFAYPYFTGFPEERGEGPGEGFNLNLALPEQQNGEQYLKALHRALGVIRDFAPTFLVVALGLDPAKGDPTGTWSLGARDFAANGRAIGALGLPTLVVQEGGYRIRTLGANARAFFTALSQGALEA